MKDGGIAELDKLMKWSAIIGSIFATVSLILICYIGSHKVVVVGDSGVLYGGVGEETDVEEEHVMSVSETSSDSMSLYIPIESMVTADDITVQNIHMYQGLEIILNKATGGYYDTQKVEGAVSKIKDAFYIENSKSIDIFLDFNGVYECNSHVAGNMLQIDLISPKTQYDKIIVIDDRLSTESTKEMKNVALNIGTQIKNKLEATGIKVYDTGGSSDSVDDNDVIQFVNSVPADMYIGISFGSNEQDWSIYGVASEYNSAFFIPYLDNVELANLIEHDVTASVNGKAIGLETAQETSILTDIQVPASIIYPGYFTNVQEKELLLQSNYQSMIAEGISKAVQEAYDLIDKNK